MSEENIRAATPWWFWVISIFLVLWNLMGLWDYYNSMTLNEGYLMEMGEDIGAGMIAFLEAMPIWAKTVWGIAIFSSMGGALLLLVKKALAFKVFVLAFVMMVLSFCYQFFVGEMPAVPTWVHVFTVILWVVSIFQIWFSRRMIANGILG